MEQKMIRFLTSIGINDIESFDLDFIYASRNQYDNRKVDMVICKKTPWDYSLLSEFNMALSNINYPYSMRFNYDKEITAEDALALFDPFRLSLAYPLISHEPKIENGVIVFEYEENDDVGVFKDFQDLLKQITYPIEVKLSKAAPKKEAVPEVAKIEEQKEEKEIEAADDKAEIAPEKPVTLETLEQKAKDALKDDEESLMAIMKANYDRMMEERNKKRIFTTGDYRPLDSINEIYSMGLENVDFMGDVYEVTTKLSKKGTTILTMGVGEGDGAVGVRGFESKRLPSDFMTKIKVGNRIRVRGAIDTDKYTGQRNVIAHFIDMLPPKELRGDNEEVKRVELHLHTKYSTMDGLAEMKDYMTLALNMGMDAIAITDHGCLQGFPNAQDTAKELSKKTGKPLKVIYGTELYVFDPTLNIIQNPAKIPLKSARYCVFDTETTGLSARFDRVIEFGCVIVENGEVVDTFDTLINPEMHIPEASSKVNHIYDDDVASCPKMSEVLPKIMELFGNCVLVAHNATFDIGFINEALKREGKPFIANPVIDTLPISHYLFPEAGRHNEGALLRNLGLTVYNEEDAHRADYDATQLHKGWQEIIHRLDKANPGITHEDLGYLAIKPGDPNDSDQERRKKQDEIYLSYCKHLRERHMVVLAKNQQGLIDLNKIMSESCTTYWSSIPRTPISLIEKYRENLLIGSGCLNGTIFDMAMTRSIEAMADAMSFYDYIEIQPLENYSYLIDMGYAESEERLKEVLKGIIAAAKMARKKVVVTGDVHYCDPEDKILRDVFIYALALHKGRHPLNPPSRDKRPVFANPDQHFRSTSEMLESFSWLPEDEAREYIITNSRAIADMIEPAYPVSDDLQTPDENLPNSAQKIRDLCEGNFEKRYCGNPDPEVKKNVEIIRARLEKELDGIINNGYAVTYYIAHLLIKMAGEEPERFIVGSRGSVGSSFAATMADITEVNALPPHYLCPKCHYVEFGDAKKYKSGFDMPDKVCPHCGEKLKANGQNIPFETFLGFNADKVPDIDLNFEDESQHRAHNYTKILLGEKNVFRAGTIETVAEKTAYGFVRGYFERIGQDPNNINPCLIAYLASKCQGVKRTTGQHPGGIVVVPSNLSVYDFTAVQYPADDTTSEWLTTHYDFRSMHDEILKFDILGHVDPMAMRYYRDLTQVPIESIPMNDPKVLSLFTSPKELNLNRNYLKLQTGVLALPEFGTNLAQRMLNVTQPKTFNDLLIISGLAHGTDVWGGNAEDLIVSGTTDLNGVIGCRDEIMTYLISMGIENLASFKLMEKIRKGKGLTDDEKALMRSHNVPEYYINSAAKIKYLFPRGHATAYVMMAVRVAYFKLYYPLEFYAVFFSVRSDDYDIKSMIEGEDSVIAAYEALKARSGDRTNPLSNKEMNILDTLTVAIEMLERGYKFSNIDLYKSDAKMFVVDHANKALIPPFSVVDGLGVNAAQSIVDGRKINGVEKPFISRDDVLKRATKLNSTSLAKLAELGVLKGLPESNQMSLFDLL